MNYWLINPKHDGVSTDLKNETNDTVYMGWGKDKCPDFYNKVMKGDVIIVTEGAHEQTKMHYIGVADYLDGSCWHLVYSTDVLNSKITEIIRANPNDFAGGSSRNPWGPKKSIIQLNDNKAEKQIKQILKSFFMEKQIFEQINEILTANRNLILTGAPGTGKTYLAKQIARMLLFGKINEDDLSKGEKSQFDERCGFVQFHPSYDYTDFVEGLRSVRDENGGIGFERKDGVFKSFCKKAIKSQYNKGNDNFDEAWEKLINTLDENGSLAVKTISGNREINIQLNAYGTGLTERSNQDDNNNTIGSSKYFTKEQLYKVYRGQKGVPTGAHDNYRKAIIKHMKENMGLIEYERGGKIDGEIPKYVFIIDEINRGEISKIFGELFFSIDPGYRGEQGRTTTQYQNLIPEDDVFYNGFYVPDNVYIIGTMNDIDRSVESMDFAFRRRFAFKEITAEDSQQMLNEFNWSEDAKTRMKNLNKAIGEIEGLSSAYHIGASYFLKLKDYKTEDGNPDYNQLWENHLEGLLREYLRGMPEVEDKIQKLKDAYNLIQASNTNKDPEA